MALILHILIALTSIAATTYTYFAPTHRRLHFSYGLIALTIVSGTYLVFIHPAHLASACASGTLYLCGVTVGLLLARRKLALEL
jgi:hypothetical protein